MALAAAVVGVHHSIGESPRACSMTIGVDVKSEDSVVAMAVRQCFLRLKNGVKFFDYMYKSLVRSVLRVYP